MLTKAQFLMLQHIMKRDFFVPAKSGEERVLINLEAKNLVASKHNRGMFYITRRGLECVHEKRMEYYRKSGSVASITALEEIEDLMKKNKNAA